MTVNIKSLTLLFFSKKYLFYVYFFATIKHKTWIFALWRGFPYAVYGRKITLFTPNLKNINFSKVFLKKGLTKSKSFVIINTVVDAGVAQWQSSWFVISRLMVRLRSPAPNKFFMGEFPSGQRGQTVNLLSLTSLVRIQLPPPTKKELLVNKSSFFVYPSRRLGISSPREVRCISSAPLGLYLITHQRASLRLDDIQTFGLMIYRNKLRM